jgi:mRNA-degrading endonuclease RelE of RelBE toxin-antitoxin system
MTTAFLESFLKDVRKLRDAKVKRAVTSTIENVESADTLHEIRQLKRLSGYKDFYRIRIGDWRIGLKVSASTVIFVRCLHRREVYRYFP